MYDIRLLKEKNNVLIIYINLSIFLIKYTFDIFRFNEVPMI